MTTIVSWRTVSAIAGAAILAAAAIVPASAAGDPPVPHGLDPGGNAIALISDGVDYTDPEIAARLARDGEGEPIALDLIDGDVRPFTAADVGRGTTLAKMLLSTYRNSRLVVVRADPEDAGSLAQAAVFVTRTPSRIAVVGFWGHSKETWLPFSQAVEQGGRVLFIVPGGDARARGSKSNFPAQLRPANVLSAAPFDPPADQYAPAVGDDNIDAWVVAAGATMFGAGQTQGPRDSIEAAVLLAGQAGCTLEGTEVSALPNAASLRAAILTQARAIAVNGISAHVHDPMCWYGGIRFGEPGRF